MRALLTRGLPAAAIVLAAGLAGYFAYGHLVRPRTLVERVPAAALEAQRAALAHSEPTAADTGAAAPRQAMPDFLPDVAFTDRQGALRRLPEFTGRPLLVNFWAPWCAPCRQEIPLLERLSRSRAQERFQVVGVAVDSRAAVLDYARRAAIRYPLLIGERPGLRAVRALGMEAVFPFSVFADARGRIVTLKVGKLRADQARLILERLEDLDRGRIDLATARRQITAGMARLAVARATRPAAAARF